MKRGRSYSNASGRSSKRPAYSRQDATVSQVIRKMREFSDLKYTDVGSTGGVSTSGTIVNMTGSLTRGDNGINNFLGNTVTPTGLRIKYSWTTDQTYNHVRVLVFQWFADGTPTVSEVLQTNSTLYACLSAINVSSKNVVRVLHDKTFIVAPTAGGDSAVTGYGHAYRDVYIPGSRLKPIRFNSGTNTCQDGNIFMLLVSDDAAVSYPTCSYYGRISFTD